MSCRYPRSTKSYRLVGDPVDVVTGANYFELLDFELPGAASIEWTRHYDSSRNDIRGQLGWGHTHGFDRKMVCNVDGLSYISPSGEVFDFPFLQEIGQSSSNRGLMLTRLASRIFGIIELGQPAMEFVFDESFSLGLLKRLHHDDATVSLTYDAERLLKSIVSDEHELRVKHNALQQVVSVVLVHSSDASERLLIQYSYDPRGNLEHGIDSFGNRFSFRFDRNNRLIQRTDRKNYAFQFEYDSSGRCTRAQGQDGFDDTQLEYQPEAKCTVVTRANGGEWTYFYDLNGVITEIIDPYGGTQEFKLDDGGRVVEEIDAKGKSTHLLYDEHGGIRGKISPDGEFSAGMSGVAEPSADYPVLPTSALEWEYGAVSTRIRCSLPESNDSVFSRIPPWARKAARIREPAPNDHPLDKDHDFQQVRDELGILLKVIDSNHQTARFGYDENGNLRRYIDREGSRHEFEYTSWNLTSRQIDPLGHQTTFGHNSMGDLTSVSDPGGTLTEYEYDLRDRLVEVIRNGQAKESYVYDEADQLVEKYDGSGNGLLRIERDSQGLPRLWQLTAGPDHALDFDDEGSRIVKCSSGDHNIEFAYDGFANRIVDKKNGLGIEHAYRGTQLLHTQIFERFTIHYEHNPNTGSVTITDPGGGQHQIHPIDHGFVRRTMSNGSSEVSQFDPDGRCLCKAVSHDNDIPWLREYRYNAEGHLVETRDNQRGTSRFNFDGSHRLVGATFPDQDQQEFSYDRAGNLISQPGLTHVSMTSGNRLESANGDRFQYNERQHLSSRSGRNGTTSYEYDSFDMLTDVKTGSGRWTASYDIFGRRQSKGFVDDKTEFYWDGDRLSAEVRPNGSVRIYIYADALAFVPLLFMDFESIHADPASGKRYFVFTDQISSPILVTDDSNKPVWTAEIDPYGRAHIEAGSSITFDLRWPGHYFDQETGLHYNRYRYYSPELGRYLQSDPIGLQGGLNVYAYTSSPLSTVDLEGLAICKIYKAPRWWAPWRAKKFRRSWSKESNQRAQELVFGKPGEPGLHNKNDFDLQQRNLKLAEAEGRQRPLTPQQRMWMEELGPTPPRDGWLMMGEERIMRKKFYDQSQIDLKHPITSEDLRNMTAHTGVEHAVMRDGDNNLYLVRGAPNSVQPVDGLETLVHSHPHDTPPSPGDWTFGPGDGAMVSPDGRITDFHTGPNGEMMNGVNPNAGSYVGPDGTIHSKPQKVPHGAKPQLADPPSSDKNW